MRKVRASNLSTPMSKTIGNFAQIAHDLPVSDKGPRSQYKTKYKYINPELDINDIKNTLLLCYDCHKGIDEIRPEDFPLEKLYNMKFDFEEFIVKATNVERIQPTIVIKYTANLHGKHIYITGIHKALFPEKVIEREIDLGLKNSNFHVEDIEFWNFEASNLVRTYNLLVLPAIENFMEHGRANISVFAIAPIPLLVKLGELLSNKQDIDIYQLKKAPTLTWEWEITEYETEYVVNYIQKNKNPDKIILILSLSGKIRYEETQEALTWRENTTVIEMSTKQNPFDDYLRNKRQLEKFVVCYQRLKEEMRGTSQKNTMVHLVGAVPVSIAVEIGRHRNKTVDLLLTIYNYSNGKYEKAIVIGEENE